MAVAIPIHSLGQLVATGTGSTSGAATSTIYTLAIPDGYSTGYEAWFAARDASANTGNVYGRVFGVWRSGGTARLLSGSPSPLLTAEDDATATVLVTLSGTNILLQGQGIAGRDFSWIVNVYKKVQI